MNVYQVAESVQCQSTAEKKPKIWADYALQDDVGEQWLEVVAKHRQVSIFQLLVSVISYRSLQAKLLKTEESRFKPASEVNGNLNDLAPLSPFCNTFNVKNDLFKTKSTAQLVAEKNQTTRVKHLEGYLAGTEPLPSG